MAYTSYFAGGNSTTKSQPNNSGNSTGAGGKGGYKSFYGTQVQSAPTPDELAQQRAQAKASKPAPVAVAPPAPKQSFVGKVGSLFNNVVVKPVVNSGKAAGDAAASAYYGAQGTKEGNAKAVASNKAASDAYNQSLIGGVAAPFTTTRDKLIQQTKHLASNDGPGVDAIMKNQAAAAKKPGAKSLLNKTGNATSVQGKIEAEKKLAAGAPVETVKKDLQTDTKNLNKQTKRGAATGVAIATDFVGGGAVKNAAVDSAKIGKHTLLEHAGRTAETATIGGVNNAATTVSAKPDATGKEVGTAGLTGMVAGGLLHAGGVATGKALEKTGVGGDAAAAKDVIKNQRVRSLIEAGQKVKDAQPKTIAAAVNPDHISQGLVRGDIKQTPIKSLAIDASTISKVDKQKVAQYKKQITDGEPIEPIVVHDINGTTHVVDGQHRLAAARELGIEHVPTVEKIPGAMPKTDGEPATMPVTKSPSVAEPKPTAVPTETVAKPGDVSSKASVADADHPITQAFDAHNKATGAHPDEKAATDYIRNNPDKAMADYNARTKEKFGASNVVSGDEAKYVIPGFDATKSGTYHEPASALAKVKYQQLLADETTKDKPVLIMAGGSGAGKTSALKRSGVKYDDYAAVIDTNSNKMDGTLKRINQALASGRKVEVAYVHRDPIKSFTEGVLPRHKIEGRIVPLKSHIETHYGSHEVIHDLHTQFKDHPHVSVDAIDNNLGHEKSQPISIDNLQKMKYTRDEAHAILAKEVDKAHAAKEITTQEHAVYHGKSEADVQTKQVRSNPERQSKPQSKAGSGKPAKTVAATSVTKEKTAPIDLNSPEGQGTSKVAQSIAEKATARGIKEKFGELANYDKVTIEDQAAKANKLLTDDSQHLEAYLNGSKPLPEGLRATSLITAIENHPTLSKDANLLLKLAKSPLASETSYSAQELRLAAERADGSPVEAIKQVGSAKQAAFEKKSGTTVEKATASDIKAAKAAVPKITKETWDSFISGLKC